MNQASEDIFKKPPSAYNFYMKACKDSNSAMPAEGRIYHHLTSGIFTLIWLFLEIRIKWKFIHEDERTKYTQLYENEKQRIQVQRKAYYNSLDKTVLSQYYNSTP